MELSQFKQSFLRLAAQMLAGLVIADVFLSSLAMQAVARPAENDIFQSTNLLRISIRIPDEGLQKLRGARPSGNNLKVKTEAEATVEEGGRVYNNVAVQLKGFTTFQQIDGSPSLTLHFDKFVAKQKFHGLKKISLNNSLQDSTRLHEKFSRELFASAGVPVPRADYALVTLNERELGLYVLTEAFDKEFLARHFRRTDGNLYEGGVLQDIDHPLRVISGSDPKNQSDVQRLIAASRESDPAKRFRALEDVLDIERFLSMVAIETILCHSDSYSMNRNNYRLYHDPATDRLVFMPQDMDRVLGTHRSTLDLPIVPPALGLVARGLLSTPEGRRRYVERAGVLFTNLFGPEKLCRRVHEIDARIASAKTNGPANQFSDHYNHAQDAQDLCNRISERADELKLQFAHFAELVTVPRVTAFDTNGLARLDPWKPKHRADRPAFFCEAKAREGMLHLHTMRAPLAAALHSRVNLPAGNYRLTGQIECSNPGGATNFIHATVLRYSSARFAVESRRLDGPDINFNFQVAPARAPEEIEFICAIVEHDSRELVFDASSLRLEKLTDASSGRPGPQSAVK